MKNTITLFLLIVCFNGLLYGQKYTLDITGDQIEVENFNYKIENLIDARPDTTNIGYIIKGNLNQKYLLDLENGFIDNISEFFFQSFQPGSDCSPIAITVNQQHKT